MKNTYLTLTISHKIRYTYLGHRLRVLGHKTLSPIYKKADAPVAQQDRATVS